MFLISVCGLSAQDYTIKANLLESAQSIRIRWFNENGITAEPINVFISYDQNNWSPVLSNPIKPICELPDAAFINDPRLEVYTEIVKSQLETFLLMLRQNHEGPRIISIHFHLF